MMSVDVMGDFFAQPCDARIPAKSHEVSLKRNFRAEEDDHSRLRFFKTFARDFPEPVRGERNAVLMIKILCYYYCCCLWCGRRKRESVVEQRPPRGNSRAN